MADPTLRDVLKALNAISVRLRVIDDRLANVEQNVAEIRARIDRVDVRLDRVEQGLGLDEPVDGATVNQGEEELMKDVGTHRYRPQSA